MTNKLPILIEDCIEQQVINDRYLLQLYHVADNTNVRDVWYARYYDYETGKLEQVGFANWSGGENFMWSSAIYKVEHL